MASAVGIPEAHPVTIASQEDEPLLPQADNVIQKQEEKITHNLITGTASVAQAGIWILAALVWSDILSQEISLFTAHPLLAVSAFLLQVQGVLVLQPTSTPQQKLVGTQIHYGIQLASIICFVGAFIIIETYKGDHSHFASPHGILGLVTVIFVVLQALVGVAQFFLPVTIFGSVDGGKRIYKYHRWAGYALLLLEAATVVAATQMGTLNKPTWSIILALIITVLGLGSRVKKHKLGLGTR